MDLKPLLSLGLLVGITGGALGQVLTSPATEAKPISPNSQESVVTAPSAKALLQSAEHVAKQSHKNVLVIFHASWCGWCHRLDAFLDDPRFKSKFEKNYVVVHLDVMENANKKSLENPGGQELMASWGGAKAGLPFYVIFDDNGKQIGDSLAPKTGNIGYPSEPSEVAYFMGLLKKTAPHLTSADKDAINKFLSTKPKH